MTKSGTPQYPSISWLILLGNIHSKKAPLNRILLLLKSHQLCGIPAGYCCIQILQRPKGTIAIIAKSQSCHFVNNPNPYFSKERTSMGSVKKTTNGFIRNAKAQKTADNKKKEYFFKRGFDSPLIQRSKK